MKAPAAFRRSISSAASLPRKMGRLLRQFFHPLDQFIQDNMADAEMKEFVMPLAKSFARLQQATAWVAEQGVKDADQAGAASMDYLKMFGLVALGYVWARMAKISTAKLANGGDDRAVPRTQSGAGSVLHGEIAAGNVFAVVDDYRRRGAPHGAGRGFVLRAADDRGELQSRRLRM